VAGAINRSPCGNTADVAVATAGETTAVPVRVVAAARRGIDAALSGTACSISERLWAYEIEAAARAMLERQGLADRVLVRTNGETVSFTLAAR
jgi:hypothetical protein